MSNWCNLNRNFTVLKVHDLCHNPKCNCQKQFTFTPKQYMLEGDGFRNTMEKLFKVVKQHGINFGNQLLM